MKKLVLTQKQMILTSKWRAEQQFAGQNTQHSNHHLFILENLDHNTWMLMDCTKFIFVGNKILKFNISFVWFFLKEVILFILAKIILQGPELLVIRSKNQFVDLKSNLALLNIETHKLLVFFLK